MNIRARRCSRLRAVPLGLSLVVVAGFARPAGAASEPTLAISTNLAGHVLPVSPMSGSWDVQEPGTAARLSLSGNGVTGTTTTIDAVWSSSWRDVTPDSPAITVTLSSSQGTTAPGLDPTSWSWTLQSRTVDGDWQPAGGDSGSDPSFVPPNGEGRLAVDQTSVSETEQLQWRLVFHMSLNDTSSQDWQLTIKAE